MTGATPQSGQLKDPVAGLGDRADGGLLERLADLIAIGDHLTDLAFDVPTSESIQAPVSERGDISLDGGSSDPGDFGRLLACDSTVQQPKDEHFFPNSRVGMRDPFFIDDKLLLFGSMDAKPSHDACPCVARRDQSTPLRKSHTPA